MIEKTSSSKILHQGDFLKFIEHQIEIEGTDPLIKSRRQYVVHSGGVCIIPVLDNGDLVMVKQYRKPLEKIIYEFPAGKIDPNESPLETAKRELQEETGYTASEWVEIGETIPSPGYSTEILHLYIARGLKSGEQNLDHSEFVEVENISKENAIQKILDGEIRDAKTVNGVFFLERY